jgi:hypothetical protein
MKLCPQCEFIYEDDQGFCDMDGKELVHDAGTLTFEETAPSMFAEPQELAENPVGLPSELTPNLPAVLPASLPSSGQSRSFAIAGVVGVVLVALLFVVYYARTQAAAPSAPVAPLHKQSSSAPSNLMPASPSLSSAESAGQPRPADVPVSAEGTAADSHSAIIWLTNGTSIKADQVWERKDGVWYRQAGVVTFLNRSQVRAIQRLAPSVPRSKSTAIKSEEKNRRPENATAQNRPRVKPEPDSPKRESKVSSFLKKTGEMLKRPFKL